MSSTLSSAAFPPIPTMVASLVVLLLSYLYLKHRKTVLEDLAFADQHGCMPVETVLPYDWPLGVDLLYKQLRAGQDERLLAFQTPFLKEMPTMRVHIFGGTGYFTTDPRIVESLLSANFQDWNFGPRSASIYPLLGEGIFTQDGAPWKQSRELLRRQFARINFRDLRIFDTHIEHMIARLHASSGIVDVQKVFLEFTLATTMSLIFGNATDDVNMRNRSIFGGSFDYAQMIAAVRIRLGDLYFLYAPRKFWEACDSLKTYAMSHVDNALDTSEEPAEISTSSSLIRDLHDGLQNRELVRDQLMHVLIAGRDTTACTMSWVFFLLVRHPRVLEKLRGEIASVVTGDDQLTRAHLIEMRYLRNIINETLRLYPQLPANLRYATKRTIIPTSGGPDGTAPVLIPKGVVIGYSIYHMHRREDLYGPDAEEFRPERWDGNLEKEIGWGYVPFNAGPRVCLGKDFALAEASYGIVSVLRSFPGLRLAPGIANEPPGKEKQTFGMFVASAEGCQISLS